MQYNHRSRLPPPPPFGRGGHPRGHKQPCYAPPPPPPFPPAPPPPSLERKYEVLMEAGRLATEYLVAQGVLPPAALQRGAGISGAWPAHPLPPPPQLPPQLQQQEPPGGYGRRRYKDEYNNNPSGRPRRANDTSSSTSSRDDCSRGSYNGRGKRKYGEYRRGYLDSGRDREKERRRPFPNGRHYEEEDEDGAPGFRRERRGNLGSDEVRTTEALREGTPLTAKTVAGFCMEDTTSKIMSSVEDTSKDSNDAPKVPEETEEGEVEDDSETQNSETEVVKQGIDTDVNHASCRVVTESDPNQLPDGKIQDEIPDKEAEDDKKVMDEATLDHNTSDGEVTNMEVEMHVGKESLIDYCKFTRTPTRPRSARAHRNAASVPGETAVVETVDLVSSGQASHMVIAESAERSLTNIASVNREDKICQEHTSSGDVCAPPKEPMLLQENGITVVTENVAEEKVDAEPHVVIQQYKEETNLSPLTDALEKSSRQETTLSPFAAYQKDSLTQEDSLMHEIDLSLLTANHRDSFIEETELPPSTASHRDSLVEETDLTQTISYENNLKLQFKEGTQVCNIDMLPQDVDLIELPDQRKIIGRDVGDEAIIEMEEGKQDQSSSLNLSDVDLVGGTEVVAIHNNPVLVQMSAAGSSTESNNKQQEDPETFTGANASPTDGLCQLPLDNKDVQVVDIECGTPVEVGGFGLLKSIHNNPVLVQPSVAGSSAESNNKQQEDPETFTGANASPTDDLCQLPLDNKDVQVIDIECGTPVEVGGFDLSKSKNKMVCSSMDSIMDPGAGIHTDVLLGVQDGYSLSFSDFLSSDIPCYPSMQSDLHAGIGANDSEGITVMDDPIYGSLADIGFMDVWGQPTQDYDKFF